MAVHDKGAYTCRESAEFGNQAVALFVYRPDTGEIEFPIMHT